jgi:hypothetical protein
VRHLGWCFGIPIATIALIRIIAACGVTPKQAGDGTQAACTLVQAFEGSAVVDSICAFAPELAAIGASVMAARADAGDAGARMALKCTVIPDTAVCATNAETLAAIRKVKAAR